MHGQFETAKFRNKPSTCSGFNERLATLSTATSYNLNFPQISLFPDGLTETCSEAPNDVQRALRTLLLNAFQNSRPRCSQAFH